MGCGSSQLIITGELPEAAPTFTFGGGGPPRSPEPSRRPSDETTGGTAGGFEPDLSAVPIKSALKKSTGKYGHDATMPPHLSGRLLAPPQRPAGSGTTNAASATTRPRRSSLKQAPSSKWAAGTAGAKALPAATTGCDASAAASDSTAAAASARVAPLAPPELPAPSQGAYLAVTPGLERMDEPTRYEAPTTKAAASTARPRVPPPARGDAGT